VDAGKRGDLADLGFGHFAAVDAAYRTPAGVHVEHDLGGLLHVHVEEPAQHLDHELHRGVVIVQEQHRIQRRLGELGRRGFENDTAAGLVVFKVVVG